MRPSKVGQWTGLGPEKTASDKMQIGFLESHALLLVGFAFSSMTLGCWAEHCRLVDARACLPCVLIRQMTRGASLRPRLRDDCMSNEPRPVARLDDVVPRCHGHLARPAKHHHFDYLTPDTRQPVVEERATWPAWRAACRAAL